MSDELRFTIKMLFRKAFWRGFILAGIRKPVRPALRLSKAALETPLPEGWLRDIRDFLTRSGPWKGHPVDSVETFMTIPALGVSIKSPVPAVIGPDEPVFTSLGFGTEGIVDGVANYTTGMCETLEAGTRCGTHICVTHSTKPVKRIKPQSADAAVIAKEVCYDNFCGKNDCLSDNCSSQKCSTQSCDKNFCSDHICGTKSQVMMLSELETNWKHPFVQELGRYFRVDTRDSLTSAIKRYIGRNMFDESAAG